MLELIILFKEVKKNLEILKTRNIFNQILRGNFLEPTKTQQYDRCHIADKICTVYKSTRL